MSAKNASLPEILRGGLHDYVTKELNRKRNSHSYGKWEVRIRKLGYKRFKRGNLPGIEIGLGTRRKSPPLVTPLTASRDCVELGLELQSKEFWAQYGSQEGCSRFRKMGRDPKRHLLMRLWSIGRSLL